LSDDYGNARMMSTRLPARERKDQLLEVALSVFASRGFHETSMNDVAEAAGVTKPVVYQHFESKRALFLAIIGNVGDQMIAEVTRATSAQEDGRSKAEHGTIAFFQWVARDKDSFRFLFDSGTRNDPEFALAMRKVMDAMAEAIAPLISSELDPGYLRTLAHGVVGASEGVARHLLSRDTTFDPEVVGKQVATLVWGGLRDIVG
jgi:AcrR family transcriptional regulator